MLDLSKLKALELPKKVIEVTILGEKQEATVSAFGDDLSLVASEINARKLDDGELRIRKLLLTHCVEGMDEEKADILLERDAVAAMTLLRGIFDLHDEFYDERKNIREQAEKNFNAEKPESTGA